MYKGISSFFLLFMHIIFMYSCMIKVHIEKFTFMSINILIYSKYYRSIFMISHNYSIIITLILKTIMVKHNMIFYKKHLFIYFYFCCLFTKLLCRKIIISIINNLIMCKNFTILKQLNYCLKPIHFS